ncbi:MAG: CBS domain-containing protein [Thermoleophilia bacterium]
MQATLNRRVRDVMHHGVIMVPESTSAVDICRVMSDNHVSCVAVANRQRDVVGVVSSTDILACGGRCGAESGGAGVAAATLMSRPLFTVAVDDSLQAAMAMMVEHHIHRVLVRAGGHIVGILSTSDVVREIGRTVKGTPECVYTKLDRYEEGVAPSGETALSRETVYDVMTHGVLVVPLTATLRETARVIADKQVHRVIVASEEGEMVGVVAAIDVLKPWTEDYGSPDRDDVIAADVMTQDIEAIEHWRTLEEAMARMAGKHIHALLVLLAHGEITGEMAARPIMASGVVYGVNIPIGLVSATDIVREIGRRGRSPYPFAV